MSNIVVNELQGLASKEVFPDLIGRWKRQLVVHVHQRQFEPCYNFSFDTPNCLLGNRVAKKLNFSMSIVQQCNRTDHVVQSRSIIFFRALSFIHKLLISSRLSL